MSSRSGSPSPSAPPQTHFIAACLHDTPKRTSSDSCSACPKESRGLSAFIVQTIITVASHTSVSNTASPTPLVRNNSHEFRVMWFIRTTDGCQISRSLGKLRLVTNDFGFVNRIRSKPHISFYCCNKTSRMRGLTYSFNNDNDVARYLFSSCHVMALCVLKLTRLIR